MTSGTRTCSTWAVDTVVTDGHQDFFTNGETVGDGTFQTTKQNNGTVLSAPFDGNFIGAATVANDNFSASWTFNYAAIGSAVSDGTFTLGILNGQGGEPGEQVAAFTLDGIDLTVALNTVFDNTGGLRGEYDIYTLTLPSTTFLALASGTVTVDLTLENGYGVFGPTLSHGAALDFSSLDIATQSVVNPVPAPSTLMLLLGGVSAWFASRRKTLLSLGR